MPRIAFISILFLTSVSIAQTSGSMSQQHTNALIEETSPYLLQHAHNPVNWYAWNEATLAKAKNENKLLLISIGYAACHWCHVMEEECFEDEAAAAVMNANFVNIKIDREERPDVDQVYMDALQMMTGSGGWPLNIVALPDGRPFWGATYVKKKEWIGILGQLSDMYQEKPEKLIEYAKKLSEGIKAINLIEVNNNADLVNLNDVDQAVSNWSRYFDTFLGGYKQAPKFMMPVNLDFLLHYGTAKKDADILEYVNTSLTKMAWGGIFDHVGGGFSRYSVDTKWHVPHFEKMLYDNGQLVSLYAKAYAATKNALYKETVRRTLEFVVEELMDENGGFYSSLDADSLTDENELEEGAYYVWQEAELKQLLQDDFEVFKDYFNINSYGHWEHGNYVLIRDASAEKISKKHELPPDALKAVVSTSLEKLKVHRAKRSRPRLDDKILTSWNGLMLRGLVDAYRYLEDDAYLELAIKNADFILKNMVQDDGGLFRNHKNGSSSINAFLEDYAAVIDAFIGLYEITFEDKWLSKAEDLMAYCFQNFFDPKSEMFFFGSKRDPIIIRRSIETTDNVIPASNSIMAQNLFRLSKLFPEKNYEEKALQMLKNMQDSFEKSAQNHANWLQLALFIEQPFYEVAIIGDDFEKLGSQIRTEFLPNTIFAGVQTEGTISLLKNRFVAGKTMAYVCLQGSCKLPETQAQKVLEQLRY